MSALRSSGLCSSPSGTLLPLSPPTLSLASAANIACEALLDNPPDLVCPITHELFKEPVINAAGQVYERSAIEAYMRRSLMDPVTRMQLHPTSVLTPVWIVKSRCLEYREGTARRCVEQAYRSPGQGAVRYVRRAVELCGDANFTVQGLSRGCIQYAQSHPSSAHDDVCMHLFAAGLLAAGLKDEAAAVYYSLLQGGSDRAQQAELLRQCLSCWSSDPHGQPDNATFEKLSHFVVLQSTFRWGKIIDIVQDAGFGDGFALRLCEELILRQARQSGSDTDTAEWSMQKEVLMKYVQISHQGVATQQQLTDDIVSCLEQQLCGELRACCSAAMYL
ncbi:hypothetical protein WJX79_007043 [Trebouxia sp. C0005]